MSVLVLLCGVQGSGKSTFARTLSERLTVTIVATDAIRQDLTGEYGGFVRAQTPLVLKLAKERVQSALAVPESVVLYDATNATPWARRPFVTLARRSSALIAAGYFMIPLERAIERVGRRTGQARVPLQALRQTHQRFVAPALSEGFDWVFNAAETPIEACVGTLQRLAGQPFRPPRDPLA